ncbi:hypothetical protein KI387_029232 [Taxus chinensis]|uniref:Uncharacterized protein n=1 Tax=Taxus chinensis TaxID=29808 RepID=A0AA38FD01_TAXCH|nr:hypothetical protein KI387_029232 [Taxus chinensis]
MLGLQLSAARGLPLCLSGMTISSRGSSCHPLSRLQQTSVEETEFSSADSIIFNARLCENEIQNTASVALHGEETMQSSPRLALALEMVEHEHRREAIRKQLSIRRITSVDRNSNGIGLQDLMKTVTEDPSSELDCSHSCAKAA